MGTDTVLWGCHGRRWLYRAEMETDGDEGWAGREGSGSAVAACARSLPSVVVVEEVVLVLVGARKPRDWGWAGWRWAASEYRPVPYPYVAAQPGSCRACI